MCRQESRLAFKSLLVQLAGESYIDNFIALAF